MVEKFNTVETEVKNWRDFTLNSEIYDLSHLNAHSVEYLDNSVTLYDFLKKKNYTDNDFWNIYLQIAISCYTLYLNKTNHNDLHGGNIFIYQLDEPELFLYKVGGKEYKIFTKYIPLIYDFDLGIGTAPRIRRKSLAASQGQGFVIPHDQSDYRAPTRLLFGSPRCCSSP